MLLKIYFTGMLVFLIYLPIFLLSLDKNFKKRFTHISSKKTKNLIIEILTGITIFIIICISTTTPISSNKIINLIGINIYVIGLILTIIGYLTFKNNKGLITKGIYKISRNPTYFFADIAIIGITITLNSEIILVLLLIKIILTHNIILNEEKYLEEKYKEKYLKYKEKVKRYISFKTPVGNRPHSVKR